MKSLAMAREAYSRGRARFDVKAERCVLLVIDMQDEFVKRAHACPSCERLFSCIHRLEYMKRRGYRSVSRRHSEQARHDAGLHARLIFSVAGKLAPQRRLFDHHAGQESDHEKRQRRDRCGTRFEYQGNAGKE
jgi:isochorismate hydrolase